MDPQTAAKEAKAKLKELKSKSVAERVEAARQVLLATGLPRKVMLQVAAEEDEAAAPGRGGSSGGKFISKKGSSTAAGAGGGPGGGQTSFLPAVILSLNAGGEDDAAGSDPLAPGDWGNALFSNLACLGADNRLMKVSSKLDMLSTVTLLA